MKTYKVYRRRDAVCLMLGLDQLHERGVVPRKQDYYKYIDRDVDTSKTGDDPVVIVERIYYELSSTGWKITVGDVVELDGMFWFIDNIGVKELQGFELIA